MFTWPAAVAVAKEAARREGASQVVAERAEAEHLEARFVVGPARGWHPAPERWVLRAKVADSDLSVAVFEGWEPPAEPTT